MSAGSRAARSYTAEEALARLVAGNQRFVRGHARFPTVQKEVLANLAKGQRPYATIVGCSDSRVPPERLAGKHDPQVVGPEPRDAERRTCLRPVLLEGRVGAHGKYRATRLWAEFFERAGGLGRERDDVLRAFARIVKQPMAQSSCSHWRSRSTPPRTPTCSALMPTVLRRWGGKSAKSCRRCCGVSTM
jgi:hypothetical protein